MPHETMDGEAAQQQTSVSNFEGRTARMLIPKFSTCVDCVLHLDFFVCIDASEGAKCV